MYKSRLFKLTILLLYLAAYKSVAQTVKNKPGLNLTIAKITDKIVLDGKLDEESWRSASVATNFFMNYPVDTIPPTFQTEARLLFDDHFLYLSFVCFDDGKENVAQSLRRDFEWSLNDNVGIYFDPFNDYTNGFYFEITPYGVQSEGIISGGGADTNTSFDSSWDNKWYSKVMRYNDKWIAELAIPLKSFRYSRIAKEWNVTFARNDLKRNQISSWIATPIQFNLGSFAYSGKLMWEAPAPHLGANVSIIPFLATKSTSDADANEPVSNSIAAGMDAKVALSPSLNLDLTINPDFSNVEVDQQVINLTRFEFQFPERRQFFLENSDLFSSPGYPDTRPFFSRRIGLALDSTGTAQQVPIQYGARISGKLGRNWRVGLLNMRTQAKASLGLPAQLYSVAIVQRQVFSRSNIDFFVTDKQSLGLESFQRGKFYHKDLLQKVGQDTILKTYSRVVGFDFNLITKTNKWSGDVYYHQSLDAFHADKNYSAGTFFSYNTRHLNASFGNTVVGQNFIAEVGYLPKLDVYPGYLSSFGRVQGTTYPKNSNAVTISSGLSTNSTFVPDGSLTDQTFTWDYSVNYFNKSNLFASTSRIFQKLPSNFNPLYPRGDSTYFTNQHFEWTEFQLKYGSDPRKIINYSLQASGGQYYTGTRQSYGGTLFYRYQPYGSLSLTVDYNNLQLGKPYGGTEFLLIRPRLDITLSTKLFLTTVVQYNNRFDGFNLNARLQWRFRPASDLFLVYSHVENKFPEASRSNIQTLVIKITYWLNL